MAVAVIGFVVNVYGVQQARLDKRAVFLLNGNPARLAAATRNLRRDAALAIVMGLYVVHGLISVLSAPTASQADPSLQTYHWYFSSLVTMSLLTGLSAWGQYDYWRIRQGKAP